MSNSQSFILLSFFHLYSRLVLKLKSSYFFKSNHFVVEVAKCLITSIKIITTKQASELAVREGEIQTDGEYEFEKKMSINVLVYCFDWLINSWNGLLSSVTIFECFSCSWNNWKVFAKNFYSFWRRKFKYDFMIWFVTILLYCCLSFSVEGNDVSIWVHHDTDQYQCTAWVKYILCFLLTPSVINYRRMCDEFVCNWWRYHV